VVGGVFDPGTFFPAYLFAYLFFFGLSLGSMAILMVHYQVGGSWGFVTRRILEAAMLTLPLMIVLFIPILIGLPTLYPWARAGAQGADSGLRHLESYLSVRFFLLRAGIYFALWTGCATLLGAWSARLDHEAHPGLPLRIRRLSGPGLVLYGITMFFASVDWVMSTEPRWTSAIFGMLDLASQGLSAIALATAVLVLLSGREPLSRVATRSRLNDLGNLLLTTVMLWAYVSFSQFLIIWSENLPRETSWYLHRTSPGWRGVALVLVVLHFAAPFLLLLFRAVKQNGSRIAAVAWGLLALRLLDEFWRVIPAFRPDGLGFHWTYLTAPLGIGGLWVAVYVAILERRPLLPLNDPEFSAVLAEVQTHA
jgi:hypothetical protein